jgi:ABC-2 type transport system ATP-binding protein
VATTPAIETHRLTKDYGGLVALDSMDLRVEPGEIFGFLGANGAGKTTAIRLFLDLIRPSSGHARIFGMDCQRDSQAVRAVTGYLPGDVRLYPNLTGRQTVELIAGLRPGGVDWDDVEALASELKLDLRKRAGAYSKGNRQKLGIVMAMMHHPALLLMDEPTSGLDPMVQRTVWGMLRREADRGTCVFFSSHVMSEVEGICERVAMLRDGVLVAVEPVHQIQGRNARRIELTFAGDAPSNGDLKLDGVREIARDGSTIELEITGEFDPLLKVLARHHVSDLRTHEPSLEDLLIRYYSREKDG